MKSRRALSTVVGAVFAIIALTSTVTYVSYSMGILDNYNQSVLTKNQQLSDVNKEKFQISSVTVPNNKLNITVVNTGGVPINFTKIWIQNTTSSATTDWVRSYVPTHNFVVPGGVLTNIGQSVNVISTNSYNVKLVTSRGNTQQFAMNSPNVAPLNIQLRAIPNGVNVGFQSTLIMIVTNNGSSTLTNIVPNSPSQTSGSATCSVGLVSPAKYDTLAPGSTAVFTWDTTVTTGLDGQTCTFTVSPPLQNGYPGQSLSTTLTVNVITFTQTLLAQNTGVLTLNYTTFRFTQDGGQYDNIWFAGWNFTAARNTAFKVNVTNNNSTGDFYVSSYSQVYFSRTDGANTGTFYIVNSVTPGGTFSVSKYCGGNSDWCLKIPSGKTVTMYFGSCCGAGAREDNTKGALGQSDTYMTNLLLYGKFAPNQGATGTRYAQSLPYIAFLGS